MAGRETILKANVTPSLLTKHMDETVAFYCGKLGFRQTGAHPVDGPPNWVELRRGEVVFNFYTNPPHGMPVEPSISGTLYFHPTSLQALAEEWRDKVEFAWGPQDMDYGMREFGIRDPNGYVLAFWEPL